MVNYHRNCFTRWATGFKLGSSEKKVCRQTTASVTTSLPRRYYDVTASPWCHRVRNHGVTTTSLRHNDVTVSVITTSLRPSSRRHHIHNHGVTTTSLRHHDVTASLTTGHEMVSFYAEFCNVVKSEKIWKWCLNKLQWKWYSRLLDWIDKKNASQKLLLSHLNIFSLQGNKNIVRQEPVS